MARQIGHAVDGKGVRMVVCQLMADVEVDRQVVVVAGEGEPGADVAGCVVRIVERRRRYLEPASQHRLRVGRLERREVAGLRQEHQTRRRVVQATQPAHTSALAGDRLQEDDRVVEPNHARGGRERQPRRAVGDGRNPIGSIGRETDVVAQEVSGDAGIEPRTHHVQQVAAVAHLA